MTNINFNKMSTSAYGKLLELDGTFIGTTDYMGITYFWNYEYRHYLRDASYIVRQKVHNAFLEANLPTDGESDQHLSIIKKYVKNA